MLTLKNRFSGANFEYDSKAGCTANGEFRCEDDKIVNISINGQITKEETSYNFWANCDAQGNVNISGVPAAVIADVAENVATIIEEVNEIINS
jgi:hypothetical protein